MDPVSPDGRQEPSAVPEGIACVHKPAGIAGIVFGFIGLVEGNVVARSEDACFQGGQCGRMGCSVVPAVADSPCDRAFGIPVPFR